MQHSTTTVATADGVDLFTYCWLPDGPASAVVQVVHGMAEHAARYARFASALTTAGYAVYASDHRGHGRTASDADRGHLADTGGWAKVVGDLHTVTSLARKRHPGQPVFLVGHSMGSLLVRAYVIEDGAGQDGRDVAGVILSGSPSDPGVLGTVGLGIARGEARLRGRRHPSALLSALTFGQYNRAFRPNRTRFDWLSRDAAEVDAYVDDPQCGAMVTAGFYVDLFGGALAVNDEAAVARVRRDLPVLLVSGDRDPLGGKDGAGVAAVRDQYRRAGLTDVTMTLYPGARHEILNETHRDEVTADLIAWLDAHLPG